MKLPVDRKNQPLAPGDTVSILFMVTKIRWVETGTDMTVMSLEPLVVGGNPSELTVLAELTEKVNPRA